MYLCYDRGISQVLMEQKGWGSNSEWVELEVRGSFLKFVTSQLSFEVSVEVPQVKEERKHSR